MCLNKMGRLLSAGIRQNIPLCFCVQVQKTAVLKGFQADYEKRTIIL